LRSRAIWFASTTREHASVDLQPRFLRVPSGGIAPSGFRCIEIALKISDHPSQKHGVEPTWAGSEELVEHDRGFIVTAIFGKGAAQCQPNVVESRPQLQGTPILLDGTSQRTRGAILVPESEMGIGQPVCDNGRITALVWSAELRGT
jgi:hypothetical protein